jgi:hypothetical protein
MTSATELKLDGKTLGSPIVAGTGGEKAIDYRQFWAWAGYVTGFGHGVCGGGELR